MTGESTNMLGIIRRFAGIRVAISREQAISAARAYCDERGWPWVEPIHAALEWKTYLVITNSLVRGGNVFLSVDCETGEVRSDGPTRR